MKGHPARARDAWRSREVKWVAANAPGLLPDRIAPAELELLRVSKLLKVGVTVELRGEPLVESDEGVGVRSPGKEVHNSLIAPPAIDHLENWFVDGEAVLAPFLKAQVRPTPTEPVDQKE